MKRIDGEAVEAEMGDVMARMKELATHRGDAARRSKRDRSALKSTFRDLITHVEVSIRDASPEPSKLARRDEFARRSKRDCFALNAPSEHLITMWRRASQSESEAIALLRRRRAMQQAGPPFAKGTHCPRPP